MVLCRNRRNFLFMNKGKFASLVLLGAFTQGCISSGIVSAKAESSNLFNEPDESSDFHEDSAGEGKDSFGNSTDANDEETDNNPGDNISTENDKNKTTDNSNGPNMNEEKPTDTAENSVEGNGQVVFVNKGNKGEQKNGMGSMRDLATVGVGGVVLGGAGGAGTVKLIDSSGGKAQEKTGPTPSPNNSVNNSGTPGSVTENENKGYEKDLLDIYKEHLGITIPLTIIVALFAYFVIRLIIILVYAAKKANDIDVKTWFGKGKNHGRNKKENGYYSYLQKVSDGIIAIATFGSLELIDNKEEDN